METVDILCLANSRKRSGRCVAGLRLDGRGWLRPIGRGPFGALDEWFYVLSNRTQARLLDVLRVGVEDACPEPHHPENWAVATKKWQLLARPARDACLPLLRDGLATGPELLGNTAERITLDQVAAHPAGASLALVRPESVLWRVFTSKTGERKLRALFSLGDCRYNLPVTDPVWAARLVALPPGDHATEAAGTAPDGGLLFTVSLSEPFQGACYKLVAGVILLPPAWWGRI